MRSSRYEHRAGKREVHLDMMRQMTKAVTKTRSITYVPLGTIDLRHYTKPFSHYIVLVAAKPYH
jgi:hypothetical protein